MIEFRIKKGLIIFLYVLMALFLGGLLYTIFYWIQSGEVVIWLLAGLVVLNILMTWGLLEAHAERIVITSTSIARHQWRRKRELQISEIKGYRIDEPNSESHEQYIRVIPIDDRQKKILISKSIKGRDEILSWLEKNFVDLDVHEAAAEEKAILANEEYGADTDSRARRFATAKKVARVINGIGIASCVWLWFYPKPYATCVVVTMIIPITAIVALYIFSGLVRVDEKKSSPYPTVLYGLYIPAAVLGLRALTDFELLEYKEAWMTAALFGASLTTTIAVGSKEFGFKKAYPFFLMVFSFVIMTVYSVSSYTILNCLLDKSAPQVFQTTVVDKRVSSGRNHTTYSLDVAPWGPRAEEDDVEVTKDQYNNVEIGDSIRVDLRQGFFNMPWFEVDVEE